MTPDSLRDILTGRSVLVIGDAMLDVYVRGHVRRMSSEAPVAVLDYVGTELALGGAANVVRTIRGLGGHPYAITSVGCDNHGRELARMLKDECVEAAFEMGGWTTVKTRYVDMSGRHLLRVDEDHKTPRQVAPSLQASVSRLAGQVHAICISDYDKGLIDCIDIASVVRRPVPVIVNAKRDYERFEGASVIILNRSELACWCLDRGLRQNGLEGAGAALREATKAQYVLVTLGVDGMMLVGAAQTTKIDAHPIEEAVDPTGAGDVVTGAVSLFAASMLPMELAAIMANIAAGVSVTRPGTGYVTTNDIPADPPTHRSVGVAAAAE